ncbi:MAG: non-canonical purine NTP pyrophosphatase [Eubacteriales bacterium]|nr:non-canonical purine NTP pyrophosphatase [Eubacteriales bacterium]MDD3881294.1 non-canonical purine NTP pyrophosphatase [Eubacteriales bacterium]MDD4512212.1 non-canonical purine NTP pyrophosphatase [Eubacteriales bacterium]
MKILYGTGNPAKLEAMRETLSGLDIELLGLSDMDGVFPHKLIEIDESMPDALGNARAKARAYFDKYHMPVFSCDSGLHLGGVSDAEQPGVHVRRVGGKSLTDDEMLEHYSGIAARHGGSVRARYHNAIWLIMGDGREFFRDDEAIYGREFLLVAKPHEKRVKGFPLDSISVDERSGAYYYDLPHKSGVAGTMKSAFREFFLMHVIG